MLLCNMDITDIDVNAAMQRITGYVDVSVGSDFRPRSTASRSVSIVQMRQTVATSHWAWLVRKRYTPNAIKLNQPRRSGRDCRDPGAMDGKLWLTSM